MQTIEKHLVSKTSYRELKNNFDEPEDADGRLKEVLLYDENKIERVYVFKIFTRQFPDDKITEIYITNLSEWLPNIFSNKSDTIKSRITEFKIKGNGLSCEYGVINELYFPKWDEAYTSPEIQINIAAQLIERLGFSGSNILFAVKGISALKGFENSDFSFVTEIKEKANSILKEIAPLILLFTKK